jgi:hypothetical protein
MLRVDDRPYRPIFAGQFAWIERVPTGTRIEMEYALPEHRSKETGLGAEYEMLWRGDDVVGVQPNTSFYPFYPDMPSPRQ